MRIQNPLFHADMPDPDVIRVGTDFYMVSTTMFYMPAAPVLSQGICSIGRLSLISVQKFPTMLFTVWKMADMHTERGSGRPA